MLITVYQRRHGRFVAINEHYWWRIPWLDEAAEPDPVNRIACPGCGSRYTRAQIRTEHHCSGRLLPRPADNTRYIRNRRWSPELGEPDPEGCAAPENLHLAYNRTGITQEQQAEERQRLAEYRRQVFRRQPRTGQRGRPRKQPEMVKSPVVSTEEK